MYSLRNLDVWVCNLNNEPIHLLYSSSMMFENSIHNIVKTESRNGGKELSFTLNNRDTNIQWDEILAANYLIPEYRIRTEDDNGEDYYLITSDSIQHNNASKNINVKVKHISCLLKFQALDLVFSDEYANTVGTAEQLCVTILAETDWSYDSEGSAKFYEKDGVTEKYRTLTASAKTGAFALLTKAADLFDAKVLFDGATKTVRLLPMNPFSIDKSTGLPDMRYASNVIEINYGVNAKGISRTRDSENIATCLYAYGAYGDNVSKFCGLQDIKYRKYSYTYIGTESQYCKFVIDSYITGTTHNVFFDTTGCEAGDVLEYYALDAASDLYVWNATKELALLTVDECTAHVISPTYEELTRDFSFLMDFSYYKENGMLTETQIQTIAEYQVNSFAVLEEIRELSTEYSEDYSELSKVININDYCKLAATPVNQNQLLYLQLDTSTYQDGIIYHTQADTTIRKKWFTWRVATAIDDNGNAVNTDASVIYMVSTDATYVKTYIKEIIEVDGQKTGLLLWLPFVDRIPVANAGYYLFSANTVSGYLGNCECNIETIKQTLKEQTTYKGIEHPVYFRTTSDTAPAVPTDLDWAWLVFATKGTYATWVMYFYGGVFGDTGWIKCMANTRMPTSSDTGYGYWYHISSGGHYRRIEEGGVSKWILIYDTRDIHETKIRNKEIAGEFTSVWQAVAQLAKIYRGYSSEYKISITADKPAGRYFIKPSVANLATDDNIMFSTDYPLVAGDVLVYDTIKGLIYKQDYFDDTSVSVRILSNAVVQWYKSNELDTTDFLQGSINDNGGIETSTTHVRTGTFTLRPNTPYQYTTTKPLTVYYYDGSNIFISKLDISATGTRTTPAGTRHAKICMEGTVEDLSSVTVKRASNTYAFYLVYNDEEYNRISINTSATGYTISLAEGLKNFRTYSDKIYLEDKPAIAAKQAEELAIKRIMMESLGSIYRESYKQDSSYVEGDEQKLFDDSLEDLETLAQPTTTYQVEYLDRYLTDEDDLCKFEEADINTAVYLIDDELNIEQWAFVDSIKTCYDEPTKSSLTINTTLTKLSQQSFTDVLSNIAKVTEETKSSAAIYKRAEALTSAGNLTAEKLEGELFATTVSISGGSSSWTTDEKGNMIFTSADNASAMMLAGSGLLISNKKDEFGRFVWRTAIDGKGINADVVNTGELNAELITAGTITADKLSSVAGEGLDISSNKEVLLFATVSGSRPSGKLEVLRDGGSLVSINSTDGITIASGANVDIAAGNTVDIAGSDVNISGTNVSMTAASTLAMTSSTMNVDSGSINVLSDSTISVKSGGNISVESGGAVSVAGGQSGSGVLINNDGVTVTGEDINLLTNSGTTGKIYLGSNTNYISSAGVLSLHDGDLVLDGADGSLTTKAAMNIAAGGNINLTTDTSTINMSAGEINMSGGKLTADGGAVEIKATSALDITSPNFTVNSTTDEVLVAGKIYASEGQIGCDASRTGGWTISKDRLTSGAGTYNVTFSSDNTIKPEDINEWAAAQTYTAGAIVKVTESGVVKYYKATADSTGKKPGTTAGDPYWEEAEEWFAIWAGGTKAVDAPFRVARDGSVYLKSLWAIKDNDPSTAKKIDLSASVWKLDYSTIMSNTKDSGGVYTKEITLSDSTATRDKILKFNNVSSYTTASNYCTSITLSDGTTLNFNSAGAVARYSFADDGEIEGGINFTVTGLKEDGTQAIAPIGGQTLTGTMRYHTSGTYKNQISAVSYITFGSGHVSAISSTIREPLTLGAIFDTGSTGNRIIATPTALFKSAIITQDVSYNIDLTLTEEHETDTLTVTASMDAPTAGISTSEVYKADGVEVKNGNNLVAYHYIKKGEDTVATDTDINSVAATMTLNSSSLIPTTTITTPDSRSLVYTGSSKTVTVENITNAEYHRVTPRATIGDLGTVTGANSTVSAEVSGGAGATAAYATFTALAKFDGTELARATVNAHPWADAAISGSNFNTTAYIYSGASGTGTQWASRTVSTHTITASNTIDTTAHTLTPSAVIKKGTTTVGTITGTANTISATVTATAGTTSATFTANALCDTTTTMATASKKAYPWGVFSQSGNTIVCTTQIRDAASGSGDVLAERNISKTVYVSFNATTGSGSTKGTMTPKATIDGNIYLSTTTTDIEAIGVTSESSDYSCAVLTFQAKLGSTVRHSNTSNLYPYTTIGKGDGTLKVSSMIRTASGGGGYRRGILNTEYTVTPTETHNIDVTTKTIDITPTVSIGSLTFNGSSSQINFTANLTATSSSGITTYGANCVIGGQTYTSPTTVSYKQVSVTPISTSHTTISVPSRGAQVTKSVSVTPIGNTEYYLKRNLIDQGYGRWAIWDGGWVEQFYGYCHSGYIQDTNDVYERVSAATEYTITRYTAGTEYTHHPTDKTLYESGDDIVRVLGVTAGDPVYDSGTATTYYEKQ